MKFAVSKVEGIIKTLSELEGNIDSLNEKIAGEKSLAEIKTKISEKFDEDVDDTVSSILK